MLQTTSFQTISLGTLIDALERCSADADVHFDFCYLSPDGLASYRGFYDHLALGWSDGDWPKVSKLIEYLKSVDGEYLEGWKGGRFRMNRDTPLWVARPGETGSTAIVDVECEGGHTVILITKRVDA